ncbi:hypothetical protein ACFLRH_02150 [Actinomycetota bacterium]
MRSESPSSWVVGLDDTDMPDIGGTGSLARSVAIEVGALSIGESTGVTRHQFFEGPGVPKTSRNSAAAIVFAGVLAAGELFETVCAIVARESIPGSDPGVCMLSGRVGADLVVFARRAQTGLVAQSEARRLAESAAVDLIGLGGTNDGVIGALGAATLRADGHDGRYVGLDGIRDVAGEITVADLLDRTAITSVVDQDGTPLDGSAIINVGDWVRPRLVGGRPVLVAKRNGKGWVNADTRPT